MDPGPRTIDYCQVCPSHLPPNNPASVLAKATNQLIFNMSVTPVWETMNSGSGEPRYGCQTLRSISCPLVSAVLDLPTTLPQRPGSPNLVSFP